MSKPVSKPRFLEGVPMNKRAKDVWAYAKENVPKRCSTCEFNFKTVCAGHADRLDNGEDTYGMPMEEAKAMFPHGCTDYGISFDAFCKAASKVPHLVG